MKGYKAFNKGLVCMGKQYAENTVFEEEAAEICNRGMHFCENPFDVLDYYDLVNGDGSFNEFAEVKALAETKTDDNKKFCTTKLKIGEKLSLAGFVKACVDFTMKKTVVDMPKTNKKDEAVISSKTDSAQIGSSGNSAQIGSSGDYAQIGSSGDYAKIGSSGYSAKIESTGEDSVICCAGTNSMVKAKKGSWITLSEWKWSEEKERYVPVCVKTEYVDGERIKEDTFYKLIDGEFKEQ
jgi:hypothetical protein